MEAMFIIEVRKELFPAGEGEVSLHVKMFAYLFGHPFQLVTNHKSLLSLFSEHRALSPQASSRV